MKSKKRKNNHRYNFSGIKSHAQIGTSLKTKFSEVPLTSIYYERDIIPEFLWIDYLRQKTPLGNWIQIYDHFMDKIDTYLLDKTHFCSGTISDFQNIELIKREEFVKKEQYQIEKYFLSIIGGLLLLYPNCPANWLIPDDFKNSINIKKDVELEFLRESLLRLYDGQSDYTSEIRMMPFRRALKNGKIYFPRNNKNIDHITGLLLSYPNLSKDDKMMVYQFTRIHSNLIIEGLGNKKIGLAHHNWTKYFWNRNRELSSCLDYNISSAITIESKGVPEANIIQEINKEFSKIGLSIEKYIEELKNSFKYDLYNPEKDEVVLGLFSRISRLIKILFEDSSYWLIDIARILLRCICDAAITLGYLVKKNDDALFTSFIKKALGQEKLLLLHLQDMQDGTAGSAGENMETIQVNIGNPIAIENLEIELGSWSNSNYHKMAQKIGFEDLYNFVYAPASGDIHGNWTSIRTVNLKRCLNPLHRFHRVPDLENPPIFLEPFLYSISIYQKIIELCISDYNFPIFSYPLDGPEKLYNELADVNADD